jgi:hypothetical protein
MESIISTDQMKTNTFPVNLKIIKFTSSTNAFNQETKSELTAGTIFKGIDTLGKFPSRDSIISESMSESKKDESLKLIKVSLLK